MWIKRFSSKLTRHTFFICIVLVAALFTGAAFMILLQAGQQVFADTSNVSKVMTDNGKETNTYYVRTNKSGDELKEEVKDYIKKNDDRVNSVKIDEDNRVSVLRYGNAYSDKAQSERSFCEDVIDDKALDTTVDYTVKDTTSIPYDTITRKSSAMRKTTKKVSGGVKGKVVKTYHVTKRNGETTDKDLLHTSKTEPKTKYVTKGTGSVTVGSGRTFSGTSGKQIVNYALKFVGNPYVYGGTSLTRGADCSGFIYSVYRHFGLNVSRIPTYSGKAVSLRHLKPGDIIKYPGHFSMYIGNGKVVHAANYQYGIIVTRMNWGKTARSARRVVK